MRISDFKGVLNKMKLSIEAIENPYGDYYTVRMNIPSDFSWNPGEHGIFKMPNKDITGRSWRAFSIASISKEGFMLIGFRTGENISDFKKKLISANIGDEMEVTGPFGWFKIKDETSPIVLFASGVGITPLRSFLKYLEKDTSRDINLVYASKEYYLFEDVIDEIALLNNKVKVYKTKTAFESEEVMVNLVSKYGNLGYYYNSGAPKVVRSIKKHLKDNGIKDNRIIDDYFLGY